MSAAPAGQRLRLGRDPARRRPRLRMGRSRAPCAWRASRPRWSRPRCTVRGRNARPDPTADRRCSAASRTGRAARSGRRVAGGHRTRRCDHRSGRRRQEPAARRDDGLARLSRESGSAARLPSPTGRAAATACGADICREAWEIEPDDARRGGGGPPGGGGARGRGSFAATVATARDGARGRPARHRADRVLRCPTAQDVARVADGRADRGQLPARSAGLPHRLEPSTWTSCRGTCSRPSGGRYRGCRCSCCSPAVRARRTRGQPLSALAQRAPGRPAPRWTSRPAASWSMNLLDRLAAPKLPEATLDRVVALGGGNPFHLEELVNYLLERGRPGLARMASSGCPPACTASSWPASTTCPRHRVARSRWPAWSAPGSRPPAVAGSYPELGHRVRGRRAADRLSQAALIVAEDPTQRSYAFRNITTQQVAYETLPFASRSALHDRVLDWFETNSPTETPTRCSTCSPTTRRPAPDADKIRDYLVRAGIAAQARYANDGRDQVLHPGPATGRRGRAG